jgi:hypothetical protein
MGDKIMSSDSETKIKNVRIISNFIFWTLIVIGPAAARIPLIVNLWVGFIGIWLLIPAVLAVYRPDIGHSWLHVNPLFRPAQWEKAGSVYRFFSYCGMVIAFLTGVILITIALTLRKEGFIF